MQVLLLIGEAGCGKSLFASSLAHDLASPGLQDGITTRGFLPVLVDAREAEGDGGVPLDALLEHYLKTKLG